MLMIPELIILLTAVVVLMMGTLSSNMGRVLGPLALIGIVLSFLALTLYTPTTGEMLGAHMIGAEVTELIQGYLVGRQLETTEEDLMHTVFPHPTLSETMHEAVLDAYGRVIHF